jgi:hypothetical protein
MARIRTRKEFVKPPDVNGIADKRGTFYTDGQELNITV